MFHAIRTANVSIAHICYYEDIKTGNLEIEKAAAALEAREVKQKKHSTGALRKT